MAGTNLGTAYVQIVPKAEGIQGSIAKALSGEAEAAGTASGFKLGSFLKKALVAGAIGATFTKIIKGAMDEGGKLQQSYFGGLDTLYGEAADSARAYAREAAKAGISMNTYSEQAVSFGAALRSAFGGDVKKAAESANMAILDMADNSAKMGTNIEMIQHAYQGFAKQNYTMLDNLKLGYGGTKTEMQRLLKDAEALTGKKYNLDNLGDVYEAIHVIQKELGIAGVAAGEAEGTFTGSFGAMRAAAQNFLGELAIGENVTESLNILAVSASTFFFKNMLPMIGTIIKSLPPAIVSFLKQGLPLLLSGITDVVQTLLTSVREKADSISSEKVAEWIRTTLPQMVSAAAKLIGGFAKELIINLPKIVAALGRIGTEIVKGLGSAIWGKVKQAAVGIKDRFLAPINTLKDKIKAIIDKIKSFFNFKVKTPHVPLPHFSISPAGWKIGDLLKGTKPSLSVRWYAEGGLLKELTLFGAGEAGPEAIIPLSGSAMRPFAKAIGQEMNGGTGDITINLYYNASDDATDMVRDIARNIKLYRMVGAL